MASSASKEQAKQLHEKHQAILSRLLRDEDNKYCVDCDAKGPRWASWNLGVFLCIRCAGIHRNLGVHISKVKSINLDTWTPEQIAMMEDMGNSRARAVYEANLHDNYKRPAHSDSAMEQFIRAKYEHKKYIAKEWVPPKPRAHPSHYYDGATETKKEPKKQSKPVLSVPGAAAGTTASKTKQKEPKPVKKTEPKQEPALMVDLSTPTKQAQPKQQTSQDLLADLFSAEPAQPSNNSNDLFGMSNHQTSTANHSAAANNTGDSNQDLFQAAETKSQSTKDSIMALYGNTPAQPNMMAYNMQGAYPATGQMYQPMMYPNGSTVGGPGMMGGHNMASNGMPYATPGNPAMMGGYQMGAQPGYFQQNQPAMMNNALAQQGMMGYTGSMTASYPNQQQQQQLAYNQQLQQQMANMSLSQPAPQTAAMKGNSAASWGNSPQTNGQTLNFDLWN